MSVIVLSIANIAYMSGLLLSSHAEELNESFSVISVVHHGKYAAAHSASPIVVSKEQGG